MQNPADSQSWNRYAYVMNSPMRFVDPTGYTAAGAPSNGLGGGANGSVAIGDSITPTAGNNYDIVVTAIRPSDRCSSTCISASLNQMLFDANVSELGQLNAGVQIGNLGSIGTPKVSQKFIEEIVVTRSVYSPKRPQPRPSETLQIWNGTVFAYLASDLFDATQSLSSVNSFYRANRNPTAKVYVDASKLTVKLNPKRGTDGKVKGSVQGSSWIVFGGVTLDDNADGTYSVEPDDYNFEMHDWGEETGRNVETSIGGFVADPFGMFGATPFQFIFLGSPQVIGP